LVQISTALYNTKHGACAYPQPPCNEPVGKRGVPCLALHISVPEKVAKGNIGEYRDHMN